MVRDARFLRADSLQCRHGVIADAQFKADRLDGDGLMVSKRVRRAYERGATEIGQPGFD